MLVFSTGCQPSMLVGYLDREDEGCTCAGMLPSKEPLSSLQPSHDPSHLSGRRGRSVYILAAKQILGQASLYT